MLSGTKIIFIYGFKTRLLNKIFFIYLYCSLPLVFDNLFDENIQSGPELVLHIYFGKTT